MHYRHRRLKPADTAAMRSLNNLFGAVFGQRHTYCERQPDDMYTRRLLTRDDFIAVVAEHCDDGNGDGNDGECEIIGGLVAYRLQKFEQARSEIYIYDLAVANTHRRRGVATALISKVKQIAQATDAHVMFVQADYGDDAAIALYNKLGAKEEVMHFDINIKE